ncbi:hypothetical protein M5C99_11780 [Acidovorax sp. NCPPB 2350]|nr:hypothetical protein M5C99_11780 [Acidovorax sp. NCPPB 2350]
MMFSDLAADSVAMEPRKAALLLHAMTPADRSWVLDRMPQHQQHELRALLAELHELGISPDPDAVREVLSATTAPERDAAPGSWTDPDFLMAIDAGDVEALALAWRSQPVRMVAHALRLRPWPWRHALLEQLPHLQRRRVGDVLESMSETMPCADMDNALALALMGGMRRCCESARSGRQGRAQIETGTVGAMQRWSRWAGLPARLWRKVAS